MATRVPLTRLDCYYYKVILRLVEDIIEEGSGECDRDLYCKYVVNKLTSLELRPCFSIYVVYIYLYIFRYLEKVLKMRS